MNLEEFEINYAGIPQKSKITICCDLCGKPRYINREKARNNIIKHGKYIERSCSMKLDHKNNPRGAETKEKQRKGRLGKKHTEATKLFLSKLKLELYQTPHGQKIKNILSDHALVQHASTKLTKSKRKVLYISAKNNGEVRACLSSYEFVYCEDFLETDPNVVSYKTQVSYVVEDRKRSLDFLVEYIDGSKKAVEIKPRKRLTEKEHHDQLVDSLTNAKNNGWLFEIMTEPELGIKKSKDATARADEYRDKHYKSGFAEYRKKKDCAKARLWYKKSIASNKVTVFCEFCQCDHEALRLTYDKNIERNGRYICEREGGHISGSKPKPHLWKENPYAAEGKKQCIGPCGLIKSLEEFGLDKARRDGRANKCKKCRAEKALKKYHEIKENLNGKID